MTDLVPGRQRRFARREDTAPRSAVARPKLDLGHAWTKRPMTGARMHVVRRDGDRWVLACTGKRATREYPGYAEQATCPACRSVAAA